MSQNEANKYRYLEGCQCDVFTPAVVIAALVNVTKTLGIGSITCANSSDVMPCCPIQFQAGMMYCEIVMCLKVETLGGQTGTTIGCLQFIPGMYQEKQVFSTEEAIEYYGNDIYNVHKTGMR